MVSSWSKIYLSSSKVDQVVDQIDYHLARLGISIHYLPYNNSLWKPSFFLSFLSLKCNWFCSKTNIQKTQLIIHLKHKNNYTRQQQAQTTTYFPPTPLMPKFNREIAVGTNECLYLLLLKEGNVTIKMDRAFLTTWQLYRLVE